MRKVATVSGKNTCVNIEYFRDKSAAKLILTRSDNKTSTIVISVELLNTITNTLNSMEIENVALEE